MLSLWSTYIYAFSSTRDSSTQWAEVLPTQAFLMPPDTPHMYPLGVFLPLLFFLPQRLFSRTFCGSPPLSLLASAQKLLPERRLLWLHLPEPVLSYPDCFPFPPILHSLYISMDDLFSLVHKLPEDKVFVNFFAEPGIWNSSWHYSRNSLNIWWMDESF